MTVNQILYGTCITLTGLLAGLFYGWQCSVMNGLALLPDREYLIAFQSMNKAIINPTFFVSFIGSLVALVITTFAFYKVGNNVVLPYLVTSLITYVVVLGITAFFNIPLNETVAAFDMSTATEFQIRELRNRFEDPWNNWHFIRTLASIASFIILTIPLLKKM